MKPIQRLTQIMYKRFSGQDLSESELNEAGECFHAVQPIASAEMFVKVAKYTQAEMQNQKEQLELFKLWEKRFKQVNGILSEEDAKEFLLEVNKRSDLSRMLQLPVVATLSEHYRGGIISDDLAKKHRYQGWEVFYCIDGEGIVNTGDAEYTASKGDCFILGMDGVYDHYRSPTADRWVYYWIHFQPNSDWDRWFELPCIGLQAFHLNIRNPALQEIFHELCESIVRSANSDAPFEQDFSLNLVAQLLIRCRMLSTDTDDSQHDARVSNAKKYILDNYAKSLSVADVAQYASISSSRLASVFKKEVGMSVIAWRDEIRMLKASQMLRESESAISNIATSIGYEDVSFFNRVFRKRFGMTPSDYRAQFH